MNQRMEKLSWANGASESLQEEKCFIYDFRNAFIHTRSDYRKKHNLYAFRPFFKLHIRLSFIRPEGTWFRRNFRGTSALSLELVFKWTYVVTILYTSQFPKLIRRLVSRPTLSSIHWPIFRPVLSSTPIKLSTRMRPQCQKATKNPGENRTIVSA